MLYGYWDCMCAHLDTLPGHVWGTHVALDICSNFWYVPWIIPCDRGMNNETFYATLLLRQAYVTALYDALMRRMICTRRVLYKEDELWCKLATYENYSILHTMMPICYSYYIITFSYSYSVTMYVIVSSVYVLYRYFISSRCSKESISTNIEQLASRSQRH